MAELSQPKTRICIAFPCLIDTKLVGPHHWKNIIFLLFPNSLLLFQMFSLQMALNSNNEMTVMKTTSDDVEKRRVIVMICCLMMFTVT